MAPPRVAVITGFLLLAALPAMAQCVSANITFTPGPFVGELRPGIPSTWTLAYHDDCTQGPGGFPVGAAGESASIHADGDPWLKVEGPDEVSVTAQDCAAKGLSVDGNLAYAITAQPSAPGEVPLFISFQTGNSAVGALPTGKGPQFALPVRVTYVPAVQVAPIATKTNGDETQYLVRVCNAGNADSAIRFDVAGKIPQRWSVRVPTPVVLAWAPDGSSCTDVIFVVNAPTTVRGDTVSFDFIANSTRNAATPGALRTIEITALTSNPSSGSHSIPALSHASLGLILVLAAAGVRLRSRR